MSAAVGRFAPSPTGRMHLGNARSALLGWLQMRALAGRFLLRIEDLDAARCRVEHVDSLRRDLEYLGLFWDGEVLFQSCRAEVYAAALATLEAQGRLYPCTCSRAEIARAASAPHLGEEGPRYPGTCAHGPPQPGRPAALRFRVEPGEVGFTDLLAGPVSQDVEREVGDFVVRRADMVASYQLAVVVDDAASQVTHVLRADDLLSSTPRQLLLYRALGLAPPSHAHVPLVLGADGKRLAKRTGSFAVAELRERKVPPERVVGLLARWSGLSDGSPVRAEELAVGFETSRVARAPQVATEEEIDSALGGFLR